MCWSPPRCFVYKNITQIPCLLISAVAVDGRVVHLPLTPSSALPILSVLLAGAKTLLQRSIGHGVRGRDNNARTASAAAGWHSRSGRSSSGQSSSRRACNNDAWLAASIRGLVGRVLRQRKAHHRDRPESKQGRFLWAESVRGRHLANHHLGIGARARLRLAQRRHAGR